MPLTSADLTTNIATSAAPDYVVSGDGVFDDLMETMTAHIDAQYKLGRITGTDYSTVYLGALQATIQQAVTYLLGQEKTNSDVTASTADNVLKVLQGALVVEQTLKTTAEELLVDQKCVTEWANTEQSAKVAPTGTSVIGAQILKSTAEVGLLDQKAITEFGQTNQATLIAPDSTSVLGKQILLSIEQAKGFKWNADQKYLKTLLDAWSINISTSGVAATGVDAINETGTGNINTQITNAEPV
jgi:hypothetical protein